MLNLSVISQSKGENLVSLEPALLDKIRRQRVCSGIYNGLIALHVLHNVADSNAC